MSDFFSQDDIQEMEKLSGLVRHLNSTGHNPATSGNYSLRSKSNPKIALVSESGIDKSNFNKDNFLPLFYHTGQIHPDFKDSGRKPSDETDIHLAIYQKTTANCVLHSHMLEALLFADLFRDKPYATIEGLELLKGFNGVKAHNTQINIPCFDNTQDIAKLAEEIKPAIVSDKNNYGLLLRGHGLYIWGESIDETKRHLEVFEYVFNYYLRSNPRNKQ